MEISDFKTYKWIETCAVKIPSYALYIFITKFLQIVEYFKGIIMRQLNILTFFIFTISFATSTGWHETFNTDVTADSVTGELPSDYTWYWWTWGMCYTENGQLVLQGEAPNPMNAERSTVWLQTDDGDITPDSATMYIKMKAESSSTDSAHAFFDQIHIPVAADPLFLANRKAYTVVVAPWNGVIADYYFETEVFNSSPAPGVGYGEWFWLKIESIGQTVSVWTYAHGDEPSVNPNHSFTTANVTSYAALQFIIAVTNADSTTWLIDDFYYNMDPSVSTGDETILPSDFKLNQNFPNPFNPATSIQFSLLQDQHVRLSIFDLKGEVVAELMNETVSAGNHDVMFNGNYLPSGVYFYRLETDNGSMTKKMLLLK